MGAKITGTGSYLPRTVVKNDFFKDLNENYYDGLVDYFQGAEERRHAAEDETARYMAVQAGKKAIEDAGVDPKEIDLLISTMEPLEFYMPKDNYLVMRELGITKGTCIDHNVCCASYVSMLGMVSTFINAGKYKKALIICSTSFIHNGVDKTKDYSLVGDGAAAIVVEMSEVESFIGSREDIYPEYFEFNWLKNAQYTGNKEVFTFTDDPNYGIIALKLVTPTAEKILEEFNYINDDLDWFITHQPGFKSIEMWSEELNIDINKNLNTFKYTANMGAPNIPYILDYYTKREKRIKRGDKILFLAPGSGMHVSSVIWQY